MKVVSDYTYLGSMMLCSGKVDNETLHRIGKVNAVYYQIGNTVIGKKSWDCI